MKKMKKAQMRRLIGCIVLATRDAKMEILYEKLRSPPNPKRIQVEYQSSSFPGLTDRENGHLTKANANCFAFDTDQYEIENGGQGIVTPQNQQD